MSSVYTDYSIELWVYILPQSIYKTEVSRVKVNRANNRNRPINAE